MFTKIDTQALEQINGGVRDGCIPQPIPFPPTFPKPTSPGPTFPGPTLPGPTFPGPLGGDNQLLR
jgi:hypothetical protein